MRRLALVVIASFSLSGCDRLQPLLSKFGHLPTIKEQEPNDHFTQATPILPNCRVEGTIRSPDDIDMYRLDVNQDSGVMSVHVGGIREVDFILSILDKDRQELVRYDETGVGGDEEAVDVGVRRGTYYISLSNKNPKANNPSQIYVMEVKTESSQGREMEPNNSALTANVLVPGGMMRGHYFPTQNLLAPDKDFQEEDWYRIHVANPGQSILNIDVSEVPKVQPVLELYDVNSYKIKEVAAAETGDSVSLKNIGVKGPADYLIRLFAKAKHTGNADVPYEILTELIPYNGTTEFEPNDQRLDATPFQNDSIAGTIAPAGDVDWYKITIDTDAKQILSAEVSGVPEMDLVLKLCDEVGNPIISIDNMGPEQPEALTGIGVKKGTYYLVVSEKTGKKSDARHSYTLSKKLTPYQPGLEFELNDSSQTAQEIKVGESVDGYLAPKGDVDWYQFNVYKSGELVADLTGILNVQLQAALLDQDFKELASASAKRPGDSLSLSKPLSAGTYEIRINAAAPDQNNVRDKYTLRLKLR